MTAQKNDHIIITEKTSDISYDNICSVITRSFDDALKTRGVRFSSSNISGDELEEIINNNNGVCFVALAENQVVGTLSCVTKTQNHWFYKGQALKIRFVAVLPEFSGKKIASRLVDCAKNLAICQKHDVAVVATPENNTPAICLYEKAGFIPVRYRKHNGQYIIDLAFWPNGCPHSKLKCKYKFAEMKLKCKLRDQIKRK